MKPTHPTNDAAADRPASAWRHFADDEPASGVIASAMSDHTAIRL
jgi:hypothetical protein